MSVEELAAKAVSDPYRSIQVDVDLVLSQLSGGAFFVSGVVYDVETGLIEIVVPPIALQ